jgi:glycosyltransferase involved in cell wall biosynthesis
MKKISHQTLWALANSAFRSRNYERAIALYKEALNAAEEPHKAFIRFNIEIAYRRMEKSLVAIGSSNSINHSVATVFDSNYYLANNDDVGVSGIDPIKHYWSNGEGEGRWPNSLFDPKFYLRISPDVRISKLSPFGHFVNAGADEGRLGCSPLSQQTQPIYFKEKPLLFVGHDGIQAGSEVVLLEVIRWFSESTLRRIKLLLLEPGPLISRYAQYADLYVLPKKEVDEPEVLKQFVGEEFEFIYLNTVVSGRFLQIADENNIPIDFPIISHIHEMEKVIDIFSSEFRFLKKKAEHWISASPATTTTLSEKQDIDLADITTVPAFINPIVQRDANSNEIKVKARNALGLSEDTFVVMGCGTVYWRKGTDLFVDTARLLFSQSKRPIAFVWLGDGPDRKGIEASLSIEEKGYILFMGNRTDANFLLAAGDVFFLSSREDPFPLVVLESAQHGVPSICFSPATGITAFIASDAGISLPQVSPEIANAALHGLMNDEPGRLKLGREARRRLFEGYTSEKQNLLIYETVQRNTGYLPSVSVIVPFFNHESYVDERINSIINQSIRDIEIIILDDNSTDRTVEKIKPYLRDNRIRLILNSSNSGSPFRQWEKGIAQARAEVIWIAEGDDSCDPNFLSTLLPYFGDPMIHIAAARTEIIDDKGQLLPQALTPYLDMAYPGKFNKSYIKDGFIEVNEQLGAMCTLVNASGLLLRKSSLGSVVQQAQNWRMCGDWLIYLKCLQGGKIAYDVNTRNLFRRHTSSQVYKIEGTSTYFSERYAITDYVVNNYSVSGSLLSKAFAAIDYEWQRFKHKNQGHTLEKLYDKSKLEGAVNYLTNKAHIAFYVHGMAFSKGGIEHLAAKLSNRLVENGWQVTIYCRVNEKRRSIYPLYESVSLKCIFDEMRLESSTKALAHALRNDKVDILVPMLSEWLFEPIVEAGCCAGVKIIASEHNDPWKIEELWWSHERRIKCFERVDAIHLLLDRFIKSLPTYLHKKIVTIPNGADIPSRLNLENRQKVILSVGRLESQKRFDRVIDAVDKIKDILRERGYSVEIYGEGSLRGVLEKSISEKGIEDIVYLKGIAKNLNDVYDRSSVFLMSSEFEGFGMAALEALAHGLPVIAFGDCNGPNEIVRPGSDGYLVNSVDELSRVVDKLTEETNNVMRLSAYDRAQNYSIEKFYEKWINLLNKFSI